MFLGEKAGSSKLMQLILTECERLYQFHGNVLNSR